MKLKATKTRLYRLVLSHHPSMPPISQTEFSKAPRSRAWFLRFDTPDGSRGEAYFSASLGKPFLLLNETHETISLSLEELQRYGLIDMGANPAPRSAECGHEIRQSGPTRCQGKIDAQEGKTDMEKNQEPDEKDRSGKTCRYYKGTIADEESKYIIHHLSAALKTADSDIYGVYPSKGKRAAVDLAIREDTIFIPVEGYSPLRMIAEIINRCVKASGYCSVPSSAAQDKTLSLKAKGLYLLIESCLGDPRFDRSHLKQALMDKCKESNKAFDSAWKELKDAGYLKQYRAPHGGAKGFLYLYELLDTADSSIPPLQSV